MNNVSGTEVTDARSSSTAPRPVRVVMISPSLPEAVAEHAGGRLLADVVRELIPGARVSVVVPDGPAVRRAHPLPELDRVVRVATPAPRRGARLGAVVERYVLTGEPPRWFAQALRKHPEVLELLRCADVIDLQWQEQAALIPWLRRVNPRARITLTLHDVLSQRESRALATVSGAGPRALAVRARWAWARRRALAAEARLTGATTTRAAADAVAVLSEKDASLLPAGIATVTVLVPPLAETHAQVRREPAPGGADLLMVGYLARWANEEGLRWFAQRVLPLIRERVPGVRVRVAGTGIRPTVQALARDHGVELLGFVADLDPLYAAAHVAVVPLLQGAGVKFKVVDAVSAGVPVVTTPVGSEGIGERHWFAGVTDDPRIFARCVLEVLSDPGPARERAERARELLQRRFGRDQFRAALHHLHQPVEVMTEPGTAAPQNQQTPRPAVSVVIPAHNAASVIGAQLGALAGQVAAPPFEVIVADNRSVDHLRAAIAPWAHRFPGGLRRVNAFGAQGVSHARNVGIHAARAEKVLICDADDRVAPTWVAHLATALDETGVVGSALVPIHPGGPDGPERAGQRQQALRTVFGHLPYVVGSSMGVRRSVWEAVGGFDEAYPAGHEEVDFCWRVQEAGYGVAAQDSTHVHYVQRDTLRGAVRQYSNYAQGAVLLWTRFESRAPLPPVSFLGSVRVALRRTVRSWPLALGRGDLRQARDLGWSWGTVRGHLLYRKVGRPPAPRLWLINSLS